MAQKAAKSLAVRNAATLFRTHLITLALHSLFVSLRFFLLDRALLPYLLLCGPAFAIEYFLDRLGRPLYAPNRALLRAGEDLDAKGLTEYMWDIVYWTWINLVLVTAFGDWAWWLYLAVPAYSIYAAATTIGGLKGMLGGMGGAQADESAPAGESKRQKKMEKRGGQRVAYRQ